MPAQIFPVAGYLGEPTRKTGEYQAGINAFLAATVQQLGSQTFQSLTLATDDVTPSATAALNLKIDTQGGGATDDLRHILTTNIDNGRLCLVRSANSARTVVVKNGVGGSGQILTIDGADFSLTSDKMATLLVLESSTWIEIFRSYGANTTAFRSFLGLGTAALLNSGTGSGNVPLVSNLLGKRTVVVPADAIRPQSTSGCSSPAQSALTAGQPEIVSVDFDANTQEFGVFSFSMPKNYDGGTIEALFAYVVNAAVSTTVRFGLQAVSVADGENVDVAYGTAVFVTDTYGGVANRQAVSPSTGAITIAGTPAPGERTYFRVSRDIADTTTQDARLQEIIILYTADKLNDS